ncbi:hypothetical protein F6J84_12300 [Microbacterium caowuchunii]|uniref:DUF6492 family protein n=1 Tax=Microbacterium caowuchunii TaxID=2614638 RepID=UPI001247A222|nr:DUF6492 family protein [Microbacterium caowuchunii]QEW00805.1 hypothetical protein F6J84_12300 [Microbacterium caowuchunii]
MNVSDRDVSLVTVSYRGDLELAQSLCRSVDAYLDDDVEHILIVSRADAGLFEPLCSERRRIVLVEDVLPSGYVRIPAPQELRIGGFRRRVRELWKTPRGVARGWIIQQIVKLSAPSYSERDTIVFADSDIELLRALPASRLLVGGRTRLYRVPGATTDSPDHVRWHRSAERLLGMPDAGHLGSDYIGNLITWRTDVLRALQARLTEVAHRRWDVAIAGQKAFSEYVLYGAFAEHVLGEEASGHTFTDEDLIHAGWFYDLTAPEGIDAFRSGMLPQHVGVAIQSTEGFTLEGRRELIDSIREKGLTVPDPARAGAERAPRPGPGTPLLRPPTG